MEFEGAKTGEKPCVKRLVGCFNLLFRYWGRRGMRTTVLVVDKACELRIRYIISSSCLFCFLVAAGSNGRIMCTPLRSPKPCQTGSANELEGRIVKAALMDREKSLGEVGGWDRGLNTVRGPLGGKYQLEP